MHKGRLEAFSDGVIAIIITIMVLELKVPHGASLTALLGLRSIALCYCLSFLYVAIYWNNHHHLFQAVTRVNGAILWANMHLLFWLSLIPFVTTWAGENHFAALPTFLYGTVLLMAGVSYSILTRVISQHGVSSVLAQAMGRDFKGKASLLLYGVSLPVAVGWPRISFAIYVLVAAIWLIPDSRIEARLKTEKV